MEKICKKVLHFKKRCVIIIHVAKICRCDGIGRRDRLKICWGDPCRFESGHRHQMESSFRTALFFFSNCLKWRSFAVFGSFYFCLENVRKRKKQSGCTRKNKKWRFNAVFWLSFPVTGTITGHQFWYNEYRSGCPVSFCKSPYLQGFSDTF